MATQYDVTERGHHRPRPGRLRLRSTGGTSGLWRRCQRPSSGYHEDSCLAKVWWAVNRVSSDVEQWMRLEVSQ